MEGYYKFITGLGRFIFWIAGIILLFMMFITVIDVLLRYFSKSIAGTYELVSFAGALLVGFAIAKTTMDEAHVTVDLLIEKIPPAGKKIFRVLTRIAGGLLFLLISWSFFEKGKELFVSKEVSMTLHIPFSPVAFGLGFCALIEAVLLFSDSLRIMKSNIKTDREK
ncbi:MAG: TRAP transporter small permease [Deltaproteobacteria bacterium]|nr:TRAP transporter small permease [Deltaproteobacteria bacterium]